MTMSVRCFFRASANEPPMRPVPRIVTRWMRCGDMKRKVYRQLPSSGHPAADSGSDDAQLGHELSEGVGFERLRAVGEGMLGIVVDFDEQAVGSGSDRGARHGRNFVASTSSMRRIGPHGQVRKLLNDGNGGEIEGVAGVSFKCADAALAEDYVVVAAGQNVF